jgi:hypothetical protein
VSNAFSLFYADINISDSSLGFVNNAAVQMSLIYIASHYLCNPYMYIRTHPRCHNMWCVCACECADIVYKHTIPWNIRPIRAIYITRPYPLISHAAKTRYFIVAGVWIGCYKKKVSWVEIPVAKWSFLVLLCCVWTVRVVGLIGVQLWGHCEATRWVASSQTSPRSVALILLSAAVKVFAQHISVNVLRA